MRILLFITASSLLFGVLSAIAADTWLSERIAILGSFAGLQYSLNPGIAWGIRLPAGVQELLIGGALIAVAFLARNAKTTLSKVAFGMVLGGGLANIIDRLRDSYVTDYFQIGTFPIFNVADGFVTIGVGLLLVESLLFRRG